MLENRKGETVNISETFVRRPIATSLLMLAITVFGVVAYRVLPVSELPNVDMPTVTVTANLPGANPETMASAVATPLERQFSTISGLDSMTSSNSLGSCRITLQFNLDRNIDGAAQDVQAAITQSAPLLPAGMPTPPTFIKANPADDPVIRLAMMSGTMPMSALNEYAETVIAPRMSMISGVAQVQIQGTQKYAVRVQLDPHSLAAKQIGINEVENALRNWNVNLPTGTLDGPAQSFTLMATGQLLRADAYRSIVVAYRNGSPVHLSDLGNVLDSVEDVKTAAWYKTNDSSQRSISLWILRQPGTNEIEIRDAVMKLLPELQKQLPPSIEFRINNDDTLVIRQSFHDIKLTVAFTLSLVVIVIFLFLRNFSATVIPSLALPFSIIGTFSVMYLLGYSLNNLSMMALILSIGFVVDDAIVMLENIVRHMELGEKPWDAALNGAQEVGFTIVSMTLSLAAVFIPVIFMGGILGKLLKEFGMTIMAAILISGVVSVTLTPMLCSRFLRSPKEQRHGHFYAVTERFFDGMFALYRQSLRWVLEHRVVMMTLSVLIFGATVYLFLKIPKGFIPSEDRATILVVTEAPQGTSFPQMVRFQEAISEIVQHDPNVEGLYSNLSGGTAAFNLGGNNIGRLFLRLKPRSERIMDVDQIIASLRPKFAAFPGMRVYLQNPPPLRLGGSFGKSLYQFTLQGPNTDDLYRQAQNFEPEMARLPALQDVGSDLQIRNPQVNVLIDREKAAALNLTVQQIENVLYDSYGSRWISTIYAPNNQYKVLLELEPQYQVDPEALSLLYLKSSDGRLVPLNTLAKLVSNVGPQTINHLGQLPAVTISFNLKPGVSLGEAVTQVEDAARKFLSDTISTTFQGTAKAFEASFSNLWILLAVAILVVYIVLGVLYESYVHPITILSGLPSAGFGALLTLMLFRVDLNLYSFVGLIMLVGIVKKNAIMQIDFALEAERKEGKTPLEAIYQGCLIRFRPIMMTSMSALFGTLPIAFGYGAGGESRRPLGLAVVGGLLFSQLITLYLTPVVYTYLAALQERFHRRREKKVLVATPTTT
jgi:hydrophobic/amphiphilic exporter-1 (mainly G- bacteria), HAE1 family